MIGAPNFNAGAYAETTHRRLFAATAVLFFVSGATGLVYEQMWARLLRVALGSAFSAQIAVLSTFFAGIAIGSALGGRYADRHPRRLLSTYAVLELVIAGCALLILPSVDALDRAWIPGTGIAAVARVAVFCMLLLPPTVAMGATLPILTRRFVTSRDRTRRAVATLYFANSGGAVVGCFAAIWLLAGIGVAGAITTAALANVAIAFVAVLLDHRTLQNHPGDEDSTDAVPELTVPEHTADGAGTPTHAAARHVQRLPIIAAATGCAALMIEVAWIRVFAITFGSSQQAFTITLAAFIAGIALGSALISRFATKGNTSHLLRSALCLSATVIALQIPFYEHLPFIQFQIAQALERRPDVYPLYLSAQFALALLWMLPFTIASGAALPLIVDATTTSAGDSGTRTGHTFAANTAGTVVGPIIAALAMPVIGVRGVLVTAAAGIATALLAIAFTRRQRTLAIAVLTVVAATALLPAWNASVLHAGGFRRWTVDERATMREFRRQREQLTVLYSRDGALDSVVVLENEAGERFMKVNGKTDASDTPDLATQELVAHIPLLLRSGAHQTQHRVFIVGVGSGVTLGAAAVHPNTHIVAAELSRGVLGAAAYFDHVNNNALTHPNIDILRADARAALRRLEPGWDLIINQPSNPWIAGNAALFTEEFFTECRDRLADDGMMAQWMHLYAMDDDSARMIVQTFTAVFPHVTIWWPQQMDVLLIGTKEPLNVDMGALRAAIEVPDVQRALSAHEREGIRIHTVERFAAIQMMSESSVRSHFGGGETHRDRAPALELRAPVHQFTGAQPVAFSAIDDRLNPARSGLLTEQLAVDDDILTFFSERKTPVAARITGSLEHARRGEQPAAEEFAGFAARATAMPVFLETWRDAIRRTTQPQLPVCAPFIRACVEHLPLRATIFASPNPASWLDAFDHCLGDDGVANAWIELQAAKLLAALGDHRGALARCNRSLQQTPDRDTWQAAQELADELESRP